MDRLHNAGQATREAAVQAVQKLPFRDLIASADIVRLGQDGTQVSATAEELDELARGEKLLGVYFSAGWCGPCRRFTPMLVSLYMAWQARGMPYEVLFVTWDHTEEGYDEYTSHATMPWLALGFGQQEVVSMLTMRYDVKGIPALFVLEPTPDRGMVTTDARADVEQYVAEAIAKWRGLAVGRVSEADVANGMPSSIVDRRPPTIPAVVRLDSGDSSDSVCVD